MWRLVSFFAGLTLLALSGTLVYARRETNLNYFILGEYYDSSNFDYTVHYYLYTPEGKRLFPVEGMAYTGDFPYFDLYWSPDARHFYYTDAHTFPMAILSLNGRQKETLMEAGSSVFNYGVSISPNGQHVAFMEDKGRAGKIIWIISPDGRERQKLPLPQLNSEIHFPFIWSPDSEWLYMRVCDYRSSEIGCALTRARGDGSAWETIIPVGFLDEEGLAYGWSADGTRLAYASSEALQIIPFANAENVDEYDTWIAEAENGGGVLWVGEWIIFQPTPQTLARIHPDGNEEQVIATLDSNADDDQAINLLPFHNGAWVYYLDGNRSTHVTTSLYAVNILGGESYLILENVLSSALPQLGPDGWIYAAQYKPDVNILVRFKADGSSVETLYTQPNAYSDFRFKLTPDEQWVLIGGYGTVHHRISLDGRQVQRLGASNYDSSDTFTFSTSPLFELPYQPIYAAGVGFGLIGLAVFRLPRFKIGQS